MSDNNYSRTGAPNYGAYPYRKSTERSGGTNQEYNANQPYRGNHAGYRYQSQHGPSYQYAQQQHPYDDYQGYDYGYRSTSGYRGRVRGARGSGGHYNNMGNRNPNAYGYQSDRTQSHPYARPISSTGEQGRKPLSQGTRTYKEAYNQAPSFQTQQSASHVDSKATASVATTATASSLPAKPTLPPLDFSEKHWVERIHVSGEVKKALSNLFDDLDRVNNKLTRVGIKRMEIEVEVMKFDRFSKTGEERCKLADDQLEAMNLEL